MDRRVEYPWTVCEHTGVFTVMNCWVFYSEPLEGKLALDVRKKPESKMAAGDLPLPKPRGLSGEDSSGLGVRCSER